MFLFLQINKINRQYVIYQVKHVFGKVLSIIKKPQLVVEFN